MNDIKDKLLEINELIDPEQILKLKNKILHLERVICPLNKRYVLLPAACIGYHYICEHLDLSTVICNHPEKREKY